MLNGSYEEFGNWQWKNVSQVWDIQRNGLELCAPLALSSFGVGSAWFASRDQAGQYTNALVHAFDFLRVFSETG